MVVVGIGDMAETHLFVMRRPLARASRDSSMMRIILAGEGRDGRG